MKKFGTSVKMIAHRGFSVRERENTAAAFIAAGNRSFYGIECDIRLTRDDVFVVCHDADTGRVAPEKHAIRDLTYQELLAVNLYDTDHEPKPYLKVPTLREYLTIAMKYRKHCFIELKPKFSDDELKRFLEEISLYGSVDMITVISFNYSNLARLRKLSPDLSMQFLMGELPEDAIALCESIGAGADVHYKNVAKKDIARFHKHGIAVNVWTIDDPTIARQFARWKVDYITTNALE